MIRHSRSRTLTESRRGQSLILMFFILVALVGVMALTLDYGFVLLARRQMQTGVNTAAMEGLRGQGLSDYDDNMEEVRRMNATEILRLSYDDDFDLSANETTIGAGINSSLIQGNGFRSATIGPDNTTLAEDLDNRSSFIFRPDNFELNQDNEQHGDMVVGTFDSSSTDHAESSDYSRGDFTATTTDPNSFLVRMRRTHDPDSLDEVPGVSSRGGGLPLMLGRAGWMNAEDATADYAVRRDGILVRATAIADAAPARTIGVANLSTTPPLLGLGSFAIQFAGWQTLNTGTQYDLDITTGVLTEGTDPTSLADVWPIRQTASISVGETLAALRIATWNIEEGTHFVPIIKSSDNATITTSIVVGFAQVELTEDAGDISITPAASSVPPENASSAATSRLAALVADQLGDDVGSGYSGLSAADQSMALGALITEAFAASNVLRDRLKAPALRRSIR